MNSLYAIGWFLWLGLSVFLVFEYIGFNGLTSMFPEGRRSWHLPAQWAALAFFAAAVLCNPWITWSLK